MKGRQQMFAFNLSSEECDIVPIVIDAVLQGNSKAKRWMRGRQIFADWQLHNPRERFETFLTELSAACKQGKTRPRKSGSAHKHLRKKK
jgi:hypothetical protein